MWGEENCSIPKTFKFETLESWYTAADPCAPIPITATSKIFEDSAIFSKEINFKFLFAFYLIKIEDLQ